MARALDLRQIAAGFDIIVLHIHPFDPLPILALSWPNRPPTIFLNHAPHLFWLGRSISDVVTFGRDAAKEICVARRGIDPDACFFLPVVIDPENTKATARDDIRRELQVGARDLLLITVASESKLQTVGSHDLGETVIEAISADPNIVWRVVGPSPNGRWAEFAERTEGRVRAVGVRDDHGLYAAADVFVDSYPFASRTAMFDAAAAGIPLLAPRWHPPAATILSSWGSPVDAAILPFDDELSLARQLRILRKEKTRRRWGRLAAERISESYRATWVARLNDLYAFAAERASLRNDLGSARHPLPAETQPNDLDRYLRQIYSVTEVQRVLLGWHRIETNFRADVTFPAEEASLAESTGLAAFIGEQSLTIRDHEARIVDLEQMLAAQSPGSA
jgi:glycosyltransferase involved in cell wall biosynthesis